MVRRGSVLVVVVACLVALTSSPAMAAVGSRNDDYNRDGISDLLAINKDPGSNGCLYRWSGDGAGGLGPAARQGCGWNAYEPAAAGDLNGDGNGDVVAISGSKCLWRWYGNGQGGFGVGVSVGCGWDLYTDLMGPGDITGDGNEDLVAIELIKTDPCMMRWAGNGQGAFFPAAAVSCGVGWELYRDITAAGDINRDGRPDLVGVKKDSECLYRFFGDGRGGFGAGAAIGCDFAGYEDLTGLTDLNEDGIGDLLARRSVGDGVYALVAWYGTGYGGYVGVRELGRAGWAAMDLI